MIRISLAIAILAGQEAAWFVPTLRKLANALPSLAFKVSANSCSVLLICIRLTWPIQADEASGDFKNTQAGVASRLLTRSLSICAAER